MIHRLLSANASPPVGLLFASWLLCHPYCCAAAASHPLDMPPPPLILSTHHLHLKTSRRHLSAGASPLVCLSFAGRFSHIISLRRRLQVSILDHHLHSHQLVVASHLVELLPPTILSSTPPPLDALATWQLTSRSPLVCPNWLPVCLTWYTQ